MPRCLAGRVSANIACSEGPRPAARRTLQDAEERPVGRATARNPHKKTADGEQRNTGHVEALTPRKRSASQAEMGRMAAFATQIAGQHPRCSHPDRPITPPAMCGKRDVRDGSVHHFHEGGNGHCERHQPRVMPGMPALVRRTPFCFSSARGEVSATALISLAPYVSIDRFIFFYHD